MTETTVDLDDFETWTLKRYMADQNISTKPEGIKKMIRFIAKAKRYKRPD